MEAVSRGASASPSHFDGAVIGVVPSYRAEDANPYCDIVIPSGMQIARNILVVSTGDVVVACGGGSGTLSEIAVAWQLGKPVIGWGTDGWAGELAGRTLDTRREDTVVACGSVAEVMDAIAAALQRPRISPHDIGQGPGRA